MYLLMSEDSILSFHFYVGSGARTRVAGLVWPTPLPTEPFSLSLLFYHTIIWSPETLYYAGFIE